MKPDDDLTTAYLTGYHKRDDEVRVLPPDAVLHPGILAAQTLTAIRAELQQEGGE
jgi:hypothetical protein